MLAAVVVVVEVVEVSDEPPLIDGSMLMIGSTVITGALFTFATAVARDLLLSRRECSDREACALPSRPVVVPVPLVLPLADPSPLVVVVPLEAVLTSAWP